MVSRFRLACVGAVLALTSSACIDTPVTECASGRICPGGTVCDDSRGGCVLPEQVASCTGAADLTRCSYPGQMDGACYGGVCLPGGCGNGVEDPGEVCDDGNRVHGDGCSADCRSDETCGNNIIDIPVGESCDDGNRLDGDGCRADCIAIACGDGIRDMESFEECDEGVANSDAPNATCRRNCQVQRCSDGIVDPAAPEPEECDDGNLLPGDGCDGTCRIEGCGNGVVDLRPDDLGFVPTEECDDGNAIELDGCTLTCRRVDGTWKQRSTPLRRSGHALAYDVARQRVVMFSGHEGGYLPGTWEWDGYSWVDLTPRDEASSPSARGSFSMVYDAARHSVVLFGGYGTAAHHDTWEWDGAAWTERTPAAATDSPPARSRHAMAYDSARQRVVMFGGQQNGNYNDTWEWDGSVWVDVTPVASGGSPDPRQGHAMTYDAARGQVVLFGGFRMGMGGLSDTWVWNGSVWTDVTPVSPLGSPAARSGHALVYDAARQRVVMFGGVDTTEVSDTWEWDGASWTDVTPFRASASPPARSRVAVAYDLSRKRAVLFGGAGITNYDDTWEWNGTIWSETNLAPTEPSPRSAHTMSYVPDRGATILFGGTNGSAMGDTWKWNGVRWADVTPGSATDSPAPRSQHVTAYDAARRRLVLFGGTTPALSAETWEWDGARWIDVTPTAASPSARRNSAMAYDAAHGQMILFGGYNVNYTADTWAWNGTTWTDLTPVAATDSPQGRFRHAMAYDAVRERIIMFGGFRDNLFNDTWAWDGTRWTDITPVATTASPPGRYGHALAYDAALERIVLFGGNTGLGTLDDTWELTDTRWTRIQNPAGQPRPAGRQSTAMAYDAARGRVIAFGGSNESGFLADTWQYAHRAAGPQSCHSGLDDDGDGLVGCGDADCWGYCSPACPPGVLCDTTAARCGDGTCNAALESCRSCPADCGACTALCGDFICDPPETAISCPGDC